MNQICLERQLDPALPSIMLDGHQIQQVLSNLLNNAEQATAERGRRGGIRVETRRQGDSIEMAVEDDGPGIPEGIQARFLSDHLRSRGHEVDAASDVFEAIEKIESFPYDLIVSGMKIAHGTREDIYRAAKKKSPALAGRMSSRPATARGPKPLGSTRARRGPPCS